MAPLRGGYGGELVVVADGKIVGHGGSIGHVQFWSQIEQGPQYKITAMHFLVRDA